MHGVLCMDNHDLHAIFGPRPIHQLPFRNTIRPIGTCVSVCLVCMQKKERKCMAYWDMCVCMPVCMQKKERKYMAYICSCVRACLHACMYPQKKGTKCTYASCIHVGKEGNACMHACKLACMYACKSYPPLHPRQWTEDGCTCGCRCIAFQVRFVCMCVMVERMMHVWCSCAFVRVDACLCLCLCICEHQ